MQAVSATTFLFTDIEGSTRLWEHDPGRMSLALARHDAIARSVVQANHGVVVKSTGDGAHAAFDDPLDAVAAALALQQALADLEATHGFAVSVRCGLHVGVVERRDNDFFGAPVNRAARIMAAAHGGQVLLSQAVADLIAARLTDHVTLRDLGAVRLPDLASPEHVYQVLHPQLRKDFPALRSLVATPNNLAQLMTSFIGRERDLSEVKKLLEKSRLLTLFGAGGIGKTRLSLQAAADALDDFPDGAWFVELAALDDEQLVANTVASVLGVKEEVGRPVADAVVKHVRDRKLLIIMDNCEHIVQACAELATKLLTACPHLKILASSREHLRVAGEVTYQVPALAVPDSYATITFAEMKKYAAVRLFIERAGAAQPTFQMTPGNATAVADICHRLDGIPLAIELAAARVRALSVETIAERLGDHFRLLTHGDRTALPRQQTLRALIDWSYNLLTEPERTVFRRLAVFHGGWTLEAAESVCASGQVGKSDVIDLLTHLVEKSLVALERGGERYRLLETTRAYALERLAEAGEVERMLRRHAEALLALLATYETDDQRWSITPADNVALAAELDNLRAAMGWVASASEGADLVVPLAGLSNRIWLAAVHQAEGLERLLALRHRVHDGVPPRDAALYWLALATLGQASSEPRESFDAALRAIDLYRALGDDSRCYDALVCAAVQGNSTQERELAIAEASRLERANWPARQRVGLLYARVWLYARLGRYEEALACSQRRVAVFREAEDPIGEQLAMSNVVSMELLLEQSEAALEHGRAVITRLDVLGAGANAGYLKWIVMIALMLLDRLDEAIVAGRAARTLLLHEGDEYRLLAALALLAALQGRIADAARIIGYDDANLARTGGVVRPIAALLRARLEPLLTSGLSASERARLQAEGAAMRDDQVFELGFFQGR